MSDTYNVEQSRLDSVPAPAPEHAATPIGEILDTAHERAEQPTTAAPERNDEDRLQLRREAHRERELARAQRAKNEELEQQLKEQRDLTDQLLMLPEEQTAASIKMQEEWQAEQARQQAETDFQARWAAASDEERAAYQQQVERQAYAQRLAEIEFTANLSASKADAIYKHGPDKMNKVMAAVNEAIRTKHPDVMEVSRLFSTCKDPVGFITEWVEVAGLLKDGPVQTSLDAIMATMPSNLATTRSVGRRSGSNWSGATPLADIFKR